MSVQNSVQNFEQPVQNSPEIVQNSVIIAVIVQNFEQPVQTVESFEQLTVQNFIPSIPNDPRFLG